jgi:site-specific DNA-methyltransferase (adenine-specific)
MRSFSIINGTFYNGNCITGSQEFIESNSVDLIITDPPYGIDGDKLHKHYNRDEDFVVAGYVEIPEEEYADFSVLWIKEADRILRPGGSIYIVSGYSNLIHILNALKLTSLKEINHIIWKYNFGVYTSRKYVSSHYHILYYEKTGDNRTFNLECRFGTKEKDSKKGSLNYQDREDVWVINREYKPGQVKNKNELPIALLNKMIQYSSNEGDLICDLFLGGFSTAKVSIGLNRRAIGFEISNTIFDVNIKEMNSLSPGYLIESLRSPDITPMRNQKKAWTPDERYLLIKRYYEIQQKGKSLKEISEVLQEEFGRGYWSIEKILKKTKSKGKTG